MIRYYLIKLQDYFSIILLILKYLRQKWRVETSAVIATIFIMFLSLLFPFIIAFIENHSLEDLYKISITYSLFMIIGLVIIMAFKSNLTLSRLIYENKYCFRLCRFMFECYTNISNRYDEFLRTHQMSQRKFIYRSYDLTIVSTIFFKIFEMYFETMIKKHKSSEPYLIDTQEIKELYTSQKFNDFYSVVFFEANQSNKSTPYEQVLLHILDEVMNTLYKKSWFVDYYDEQTVFQMVKYILSNWYNDIVHYNVYRGEIID